MDLFSLSYRIQQNRYRVAPELVAEAIMRWHFEVPEPLRPEVVELHPRERALAMHPAAGVDEAPGRAPARSNGTPWRIEGPTWG